MVFTDIACYYFVNRFFAKRILNTSENHYFPSKARGKTYFADIKIFCHLNNTFDIRRCTKTINLMILLADNVIIIKKLNISTEVETRHKRLVGLRFSKTKQTFYVFH